MLATLGCGIVERVQKEVTGSGGSSNSNKSLSDRAVDTAVGESRIGVPECDEVMDLINAEMNNPDDDFVTKAIKATVLNRGAARCHGGTAALTSHVVLPR